MAHPATPPAQYSADFDMDDLPGSKTMHRILAASRAVAPRDSDPCTWLDQDLQSSLITDFGRPDLPTDLVNNYALSEIVSEIGYADGLTISLPDQSQVDVERQARSLFQHAAQVRARRAEQGEDSLADRLEEQYLNSLMAIWASDTFHNLTQAGVWSEEQQQYVAIDAGPWRSHQEEFNALPPHAARFPSSLPTSGPSCVAYMRKEEEYLDRPEAFNYEASSEKIGDTCLSLARLYRAQTTLRSQLEYDNLMCLQSAIRGLSPASLQLDYDAPYLDACCRDDIALQHTQASFRTLKSRTQVEVRDGDTRRYAHLRKFDYEAHRTHYLERTQRYLATRRETAMLKRSLVAANDTSAHEAAVSETAVQPHTPAPRKRAGRMR